MQLQLAKRGSGGAGQQAASKKAGSSGSSAGSTKLVVRNVAFEATRNDLLGLFGPFGHLKSCRWVGGRWGVTVLLALVNAMISELCHQRVGLKCVGSLQPAWLHWPMMIIQTGRLGYQGLVKNIG